MAKRIIAKDVTHIYSPGELSAEEQARWNAQMEEVKEQIFGTPRPIEEPPVPEQPKELFVCDVCGKYVSPFEHYTDNRNKVGTWRTGHARCLLENGG